MHGWRNGYFNRCLFKVVSLVTDLQVIKSISMKLLWMALRVSFGSAAILCLELIIIVPRYW